MQIEEMKSLIKENNFLNEVHHPEYYRPMDLILKQEYDDIKIYEETLTNKVFIFKNDTCVSYILPCDEKVMFKSPSDWKQEMKDDISRTKKYLKERCESYESKTN